MDSVNHNGVHNSEPIMSGDLGTCKRNPHQQQGIASLPFSYQEAIAVVGYACCFADAEDSRVLWHDLLRGRLRHWQTSRCDMLTVPIDSSDIALFDLDPGELAALDPQRLLFLQIAWQALEHAGFAPTEVMHKTGIFVSSFGKQAEQVATFVAEKLNLRVPALLGQTACSSSLQAVHLACESLRSVEAELAIAGGVALALSECGADPVPSPAVLLAGGHGAGAVVLRRLADALEDGDPVLAVLPGSASNQTHNQAHNQAHKHNCKLTCSQKPAAVAASMAGLQDVMSVALRQAGIDSTQIGLIEIDEVATPVDEPVSWEALRTLFPGTDAGPRCALSLHSSPRGNSAQYGRATGMTSILKVIMAVERGVIPPSQHCEQTIHARQIADCTESADSPFYAPTQACPWDAATRIAAIVGVGNGGSHCHILVSSLPPVLSNAINRPSTSAASAAVLLLSAASESALRRLAGAYALALEQAAPHDLTYSALHGRRLDLPYRLALSLTTVDDAAAALASYADGSPEPMLYCGQRKPGKLAWVCSGEGTQWVGMGQALHQQSVVFAQTLERCFDACGRECANQLRKAMFGFSEKQLAQPTLAQPVIIAFQIALAAHWRALGLTPDMVLGQGIGEYAAAVIAGHYPIEQIMPVVCTRARLLQDGQSARHAAVGPDNPVATAYAPSRQLVETAEVLSKVCASLNAIPTAVPMISSVTGAAVNADQLNADAGEHWCRQLLEPDCLESAIVAAGNAGATVFLELGADASLTTIAHQRMQHGAKNSSQHACWIASARRHQLASIQFGQALLQLYVAGIDLPWRLILPSSGRKIQAPLYVFDRQRHWRDCGHRFRGEFKCKLSGKLSGKPGCKSSSNSSGHANVDACGDFIGGACSYNNAAYPLRPVY